MLISIPPPNSLEQETNVSRLAAALSFLIHELTEAAATVLLAKFSLALYLELGIASGVHHNSLHYRQSYAIIIDRCMPSEQLHA